MRKLGIYLLITMCLFITGCGNDAVKSVKTLEDFKNVASTYDFAVDDNDFAYSNASYIEGSMVANLDDIEIEMVVYSNADYASQVQEQHIESFSTLKNTGAFIKKEKGTNYYDYALISNNRYMVTTRIDNTLIFTKVMLEDRELIDAIIDELGY